MQQVNVMWFRRDLRLHDNAALYHALKSNGQVLPLFIFDKNILDQLEDRADRRVEFIHAALEDMQTELSKFGSSLEVYYGTPCEAFSYLIAKFAISAVFTNHDYEPYAIDRDILVKDLLGQRSIPLLTYKDQVIFEKNDVLKDDASPYTVFTPYSRRWRTLLTEATCSHFPLKNTLEIFIV